MDWATGGGLLVGVLGVLGTVYGVRMRFRVSTETLAEEKRQREAEEVLREQERQDHIEKVIREERAAAEQRARDAAQKQLDTLMQAMHRELDRMGRETARDRDRIDKQQEQIVGLQSGLAECHAEHGGTKNELRAMTARLEAETSRADGMVAEIRELAERMNTVVESVHRTVTESNEVAKQVAEAISNNAA